MKAVSGDPIETRASLETVSMGTQGFARAFMGSRWHDPEPEPDPGDRLDQRAGGAQPRPQPGQIHADQMRSERRWVPMKARAPLDTAFMGSRAPALRPEQAHDRAVGDDPAGRCREPG